jgi:ATP-dependent RNA helicase DDX18/HAS1
VGEREGKQTTNKNKRKQSNSLQRSPLKTYFLLTPLTHPLFVSLQSQLEKLIERNYYLNRSAKDAYRAYLLAYASHSLKNIFNVATLDLPAVSRGFGFGIPPRVNLNVSATGDAEKVHRRGGGGGFGDPSKRRMSDYADPAKRKQAIIKHQKSSGHTFSAKNPYGKRDSGDSRQFSH